MSGIDLIPAGWRDTRRLRRELRTWLLMALLLVVGLGAARAWLWLAVERLRPEVATLRQSQAHASAEHAEALQFVDRLHVLQDQAQSLERLHIGHSVEPIDAALQASLNDEVWLQELSYVRGERLSLRGSALRHAALAGFVSALARQPGISDVRVVGTSAGEAFGRTLVLFEVAAELDLPATVQIKPPAGTAAPGAPASTVSAPAARPDVSNPGTAL